MPSFSAHLDELDATSGPILEPRPIADGLALAANNAHECEAGLPRALIVLITLSVAVGLLYVGLVRAGTPADEPSHFDTVQYYARHWRLPVLGDPGVSYEGQMGPLFYYVAAGIYRVVAAWGEMPAFYILRLLGLSLLVPTLVLTYRITRSLAPSEPLFALLVTMFTALNPSLLSIYASVQNDALTIVLSLWATRLCLAWDANASGRSTSRAMLLGLITSLAILSKATAVFLVPSFVTFWWLTRRRAALRDIIAFGSVIVALTGWWFTRNYLLYGDFSAQKGLRDHGYTNAPGPTALWHPHELFHWLWVIKSYYWLPIQYYRDLFHAPYWLRSLIGVISLASLAGWMLGWRRGIAKILDTRSAMLLSAEYIGCMALYVYTCVRITHFAPRTTFPTFIVYAMFVVIGLGFLERCKGERAFRGTAVGLLLVLAAANGYCLVRAYEIPILPFHLFVQGSAVTMP